MTYSVTFIGNIVIVLTLLSKLIGVEVVTADLTTTVQTILLFVGPILVYIGRLKAGGVNWLGIKK